MSIPVVIANGIEIVANPAINKGGWVNIPGCFNKGLIPLPSSAWNSSNVNGSARNNITPRKKERIPIIIIVICGTDSGILFWSDFIVKNDPIDITADI